MRDIAVLQFKLVVDGMRDLVLVPASLVVGILSLLSGDGRKPGPQFYELIALGKRSESWINLFGALRNAPDSVRLQQDFNTSIDDIVERVEAFVVDEYRRGGVTRQAKERFDEALDRIQRRAKKEHP